MTAKQHGGRRPGAGRPLDAEAHKVKRSVTLSPAAWAIVAAHQDRGRHASLSKALESIIRQERKP